MKAQSRGNHLCAQQVAAILQGSEQQRTSHIMSSREFCKAQAGIVIFPSNAILLHNRGTGNLHFQ
jgi:hypothetical protein